ncbi:putative alternative oxidase protein [Botrytis fragariae]|uniref:Putative alternative oxidase protein n=1 Tax=Botrytis fragariae TaxID=1964551 RepID=A0A8H6AST4_9HELO|nr:putative alternative oxidase protein [Botrytis fragariae]KAF5872923.1 putative alternative oxidase protein [Botrytis fragariae]
MVTRYHNFIIASLLFVWVIYYGNSISGKVHLNDGKETNSGERKDRGSLKFPPSMIGGGTRRAGWRGGGGSGGAGNKESEESKLGRLEEIGMGRGKSAPGDASPHEEKVLKEEKEKKRLREEKEAEDKRVQEEKEDQERKAKEEQERKENEEDEETEENAEMDVEMTEGEDINHEDTNNNKVEEANGKYKFLALRSLCETTTFQPGLYLQCHSWCGPNSTSICGGLNNARNRLQTCLRLALDLGSGIILPTVQSHRNTENVVDYGDTTDNTLCPDVYWDIEYLLQEMSSACPELEIRQCGDVSGIDEDKIVQMKKREHGDASHHIGTFKAIVNEHLESLSLSSISADNPIAVGFGDTIYAYNYTYDSEQALQKELFRTLRYNRKLLDLGSRLRYSPELRDGYIGVHFRGESDWPQNFGSREDQMKFFTQEIELASTAQGVTEAIKTIYISCGDEAAISTFREPLSALGYRVYDKWNLASSLSEPSLLLEEMEFDTIAIIDYAVLVEAALFLGVWMSTFSQTIAYARTVELEQDYWETYVNPGSRRDGLTRLWDQVPALKGDETTKILVINTGGFSNMDSYP